MNRLHIYKFLQHDLQHGYMLRESLRGPRTEVNSDKQLGKVTRRGKQIAS